MSSVSRRVNSLSSGLMITTECVIADKPEDTKKMMC
jgi:hypothetical protein